MTAQPARSNPAQTEDVLRAAAERWARRDLMELASDAARHITAGTATDWGLAAAVDSPIPPITFGGGIPDPSTLPRGELLAAIGRAFEVEDDSPLRYGGALGHEELRTAIAERYTRDRGRPVDAKHFMLTNGSAGAISMVCAALLSPGDIVIAEAPTFSGTLRTFRGHQAEVVSVPMDGQGLVTSELERTMQRLASEGRPVKLIYTISNFHNPTAVAMSMERRQDLLRIASEHGAFVLDDDAYGELYFEERPPAPLSALSDGHGVITVGSFSKIIATGLRVGWLHARPEIVELCSRLRFDMGNSPVLHHMLAQYLAGGRLDEHLERVRPLYQEKAETLGGALTEFAEPYLTFVRPQGGFFLWIRLQDGLSALAVQRAGVQEGVIVPLGRAFFPDQADQEKPDDQHLRLAFSWTAMEDLREGAQRLARACARVAGAG